MLLTSVESWKGVETTTQEGGVKELSAQKESFSLSAGELVRRRINFSF